MTSWRVAVTVLFFLYFPAIATGILELEMPLPDTGTDRITATLALVFPDSLAGTDVHALLVSASGTQSVLLPGGKLRPWEADFVEGLRAFARGEPPAKADSAWARLRGRRLPLVLQSYVNVDVGFLLCLRGETAAAESLWLREWRHRARANEGAWRNLLGLYLARRRYESANVLLDEVLREQPHNRVAAMSKASLVRMLRPDSEWEEFLQSKSSPRDSLPDLQIAYGELLESREQYQDAVHFLDLGLGKMPAYGRGWLLLAKAQYHLGYHYFALDCLANAGRAGYGEADLYELYARVLRACCMGEDDPRATRALESAQHLLEQGLPKDLRRRSMTQLLYHVYCQNLKPDAARQLRETLWFHFEGPGQAVPPLGKAAWPRTGLDSLGLLIHFGLFVQDIAWVTALRDSDFYQPVY